MTTSQPGGNAQEPQGEDAPDPRNSATLGSSPTRANIPPADSSSAAPATLGPYELLTKLGEGGMGAVYKARHTRLNKLVAIKLLPPHLTRDPLALARFDREMKAVGALEHPQIVRALDAGEFNGTHYLAMEYVEGADLHQFVKQRGSLSVANACKAIRQAAQGLAVAHKAGLVHRDIKPSNIFVTKTGQIKLLDMGLARLGADDAQTGNLTNTNQILGTPDYMAPEQWNDTHSVDGRADLYALGCTLFFLLAKRAPYQTPDCQTVGKKIVAHAVAPIPDLTSLRADVPAGLASVITRLLAKDPAERVQSAAELVNLLTPFCSSSAGSPTRVNTDGSAPVGGNDATIALMSPSVVTTTQPAPTATILAPQSAGAGRNRRKLLVGLALAGCALLIAGVVILRITRQDGTVAEIPVQPGDKVEIVADGNTPEGPETAEVEPVSMIEPPALRPIADRPAAVLPPWKLPQGAPPPAIAPFSAEQARQHQETWARYLRRPAIQENKLGMKFALIPPGDFVIPSVNRWGEATNDLAHRRRVRLTVPYALGVTEVTWDQFRQFVEETGYKVDSERLKLGVSYYTPKTGFRSGPDLSWRKPGPYTPEPNEPVNLVSMDDAEAFCQWLSAKDQEIYRLPTEAEWEFACMSGGLDLPTPCAARKDLGKFGWFMKDEPEDIPEDKSPLHPVGLKLPNAFGLHDMVGLVQEWCADSMDDETLATASLVNPTSSQAASIHGRGGWDRADDWEAGARDVGGQRNVAGFLTGFRIVREIPNAAEFEPDAKIAKRVGRHPDLALPTWQLPADAPRPALVPFSPVKARQHQEQWAAYVKQPAFMENKLGMKFTLIPPGECELVISEAGDDRLDTDAPRLLARITQPYFLGATPVSHSQFAKFVAATGYQTDAERNQSGWSLNDLQKGEGWGQNPNWNWKQGGGWTPKDNEPIVLVSHNDAKAFCEWLTKLEGIKYRLVDESEWVFACRAGSLDPRGLPAANAAALIWTGRETWFAPGESPLPAVGSLPANALGVHHMYGTIHEWCGGGGTWGELRPEGALVRGPGWNYRGRQELAFPDLRWQLPPSKAQANMGFRVVRELPPVAGLTPPDASSSIVLSHFSRPLSVRALVSRPASIPGLKSWSIEAVNARGGGNVAAVSQDGQRIATTSNQDPSIRIWDDKFQLQQVLLGHTWAIKSLQFSPDGRWLASRERMGNNAAMYVNVWEVATGRLAHSVNFQGEDLAWSPDSRRLALGQDGYFEWRTLEPAVLDLATGELQKLPGEAAGSGATRVYWSPTGDRLLVAQWSGIGGNRVEGRLRLYDGATLKLLRESDPPTPGAAPIAWSPRGDRVLFRHGVQLWLWDPETGTSAEGPKTREHGFNILWHPDGSRIVINGDRYEGTYLWDLKTAEPEQKLASVRGNLAWIDGGKQLAIYDAENFRLFDPADGKALHEAQRESRGAVYASALALSPDGKRVATNSGGQIKFWNADTGEFLQRILNVPEEHFLSWPPQGDQLAVWREGILLLDVKTGEERVSLKGHTRHLRSLAWARDGSQLITGSEDATARIWDAATGDCRQTLTHETPVRYVAWSPAGKLVATLTDKALYVWNAATGERQKLIEPLPGEVLVNETESIASPTAINWGPDESTLYIGLRNALFRVEWPTGKWTHISGGTWYEGLVSVAPNFQRAVLGMSEQSQIVSLLKSTRHEALFTSPGIWHPDSRRFVTGRNSLVPMHGFDAEKMQRLGVILPRIGGEQSVCIGQDGHYRGSRRIDEHLVYVALHDDDSQRTYSPAEFRERFGWKNDPNQARLLGLPQTVKAPPKALELPSGKPLHHGVTFAEGPIADFPADELKLQPGQPIGQRATAPQPAAIEGLRSWSLELAGHRGEVLALAVHPSGDLVATGGADDGTVRLWDKYGNLRRVLLGHSSEITREEVLGLAWSADGRWLASTGSDRTLRLWNAETGRLQQTHSLKIRAGHIAWSPGGKSLVAAGEGWALVDLVQRQVQPQTNARRAFTVWWQPDGLTFSALHEDGVVRRWDPETLGVDSELRWADIQGQGPIISAAVSADGQRIGVIYSPDSKRLGIWNAESGRLERSVTDEAGIGSLVRWSSQGQLATIGNRLRVWDAATLQERWTLKMPGRADRHALGWTPQGQKVFVCPEGRLQAYTANDGLGLGASLDQGRVPRTGGANWVEVAKDGASWWTATNKATGKVAQRWNPRTGELLTPDFPASFFRVSPNGKWIAEWSPQISVRDAVTGKELRKLAADNQAMHEVAWSHDSRWLAFPRKDGGLEIWNLKTNVLVKELSGSTGQVASLAFSPDDQLLAAASQDDRTLRVWDIASGEVRWTATDVRAIGFSGAELDWSPDGKELAYWKPDSSVVRANGQTGEPIGAALPTRPNGLELRYSPDGKHLALCEANCTAVVDLASGKERKLPHYAVLRWVPGTSLLLLTSWEQSQVSVFDAATGRYGATLLPSIGENDYVSIGATGHYRGSEQIDEHLVYVALLEDGSQVAYAPAEFRAKFGWKNDPEQARLMPAVASANP